MVLMPTLMFLLREIIYVHVCVNVHALFCEATVYILLSFFFFFFFFWLPQSRVPRPRIRSKLQLQQHWIPNPLCQAGIKPVSQHCRDGPLILSHHSGNCNVVLFVFAFFCCTCGVWNFPGQESNPHGTHHSCHLRHSCKCWIVNSLQHMGISNSQASCLLSRMKQEPWEMQLPPSTYLYYYYYYYYYCFLGPQSWHMEVRGRIQVQLPADTTGEATWDPSHICGLHYSSWQCRILNSLREGRDRTHNLMDSS